MLSELPANSFVHCVSSRQLISNSVFRILWVMLNFFRVASQLDSFLCFGFCELHWTCFKWPANSFLCFGFCELHWTCFALPANSFLCVLTSVDCIPVPSIHKFIPVCTEFSCLYFYAFYLGRQFIPWTRLCLNVSSS